MSDANLKGAYLVNAELMNSDFSNTTLGHTSFGDNDLSLVKNLGTCNHLHKSYIDYHTLEKSVGLPVEFLRGCGLSKDFIENIPVLASEKRTKYHSCFMSYSNKDQEFADRLYTDLQNEGIRCWFASEGLKGGKRFNDQLAGDISEYEKHVIILSENSINSRWVGKEVPEARQREKKEGRQILSLVSLMDNEEVKKLRLFDVDSDAESPEYDKKLLFLDFKNRENPEAYAREFGKLVQSLKIANQ